MEKNKFVFKTKAGGSRESKACNEMEMKDENARPEEAQIYISTHLLMHSLGATARMHEWIYKSVDGKRSTTKKEMVQTKKKSD